MTTTMTMDDFRSTERVPDRRLRARPDPEPRGRRYLVISADDHLVEAPGTFVDRVPAAMRELVPRVVEAASGDEHWLVDGEVRTFSGGDSVVGWDMQYAADWTGPMRYDEMRQGSFDPHARARDMDVDGVWASLCFPSMLWGFCGQRVWRHRDADVGKACVRAYNDWVAEEWAGAEPERLIPNQIVYMPDPEAAAAEVYRNAERGFRALSLSENPEWLGLPSMHTRHWDPLLAACAATGTVINLHLGSSSARPRASSDLPGNATALLWPAQSMCSAAEWVYSQVCLRFPSLRFVISEGGVGWVPVLLQRMERSERMRASREWPSPGPSPMDVFLENFWFCAIEEPYSFDQRHRFRMDRILLETDYPHPDTSWPDSQQAVHEQVADLSPREIAMVTHENAAALFGHVLPTDPAWLPSSTAANA
jgi:predicted TIM-barrel fold metal-dependent hydrolase